MRETYLGLAEKTHILITLGTDSEGGPPSWLGTPCHPPVARSEHCRGVLGCQGGGVLPGGRESQKLQGYSKNGAGAAIAGETGRENPPVWPVIGLLRCGKKCYFKTRAQRWGPCPEGVTPRPAPPSGSPGLPAHSPHCLGVGASSSQSRGESGCRSDWRDPGSGSHCCPGTPPSGEGTETETASLTWLGVGTSQETQGKCSRPAHVGVEPARVQDPPPRVNFHFYRDL